MKIFKNFVFLILFSLIVNGCTGSDDYAEPKKLFQPQKQDNVISYFKNGMPFGAVKGENCDLLVHIEPLEMFGRSYIRLWLLYNNYFDGEYLFEPQKNLELSFVTKKLDLLVSNPTSPTLLLQRIKNDEQEKSILTAIGGVLQAITTQATKIKSSDGTTYEFNDQNDKMTEAFEKTRQDIFDISSWYGAFSNSINSGILRRNTLFNGDGVNGYVYFEVPYKPRVFDLESYRLGFRPDIEYVDVNKCNLILKITTQEGVKEITFNPIKDE